MGSNRPGKSGQAGGDRLWAPTGPPGLLQDRWYRQRAVYSLLITLTSWNEGVVQGYIITW